MKYFSIILLAAFFMLQCSGSDLEEGNLSYKDGKFTQAINKYKAFKKDNPDNKEIDARITLAYFSKGKQLFDKTKKIAPFSGNFEKGEAYLPEEWPSPELEMQYSDLLYEFAVAYHIVKPENSVQKDEYFDNTLKYLDLALMYNPENKKADDKLNEIKQANFQQMLNKGIAKFKEAKKSKNSDLYVSAEWYLNKAVEFSGSNEEAEKYLNDTRKKTINILSYRTPLNFCVTSYQIKKDNCFIALAVQNFTDEKIGFDLNSLVLTSTDGEEIKADLKKTAKMLVAKAAMREVTDLQPQKLSEGQIIYTVKPGTKLASLSYKVNDKVTIAKHFPI